MGPCVSRRAAVVLWILSFRLFYCSDETNPFHVPPEFTFPDTVIAYVGHLLDTVAPQLLRNIEVDSYTVRPALPESLRFDPRTGKMFGLPPASPGRTVHTLYGHNVYGTSAGEVFSLIVCPAEPAGLRVALLRPDSVRLAWASVAGAGAYEVLRARAINGPFAVLGTSTDTFFVDRANLKTDSVYFYYVRAQSGQTLPSLPSDTVSATIPSPATLPPPLVTILSPSQHTVVRDTFLVVRYEIDAALFVDTVRLVEGRNVVVVDSTNGAGKRGADSVVVYLDRTPPSRPVVTGTTPTNNRTPSWHWHSGGGGSGAYRYRLDTTDVTRGTETRDTTFTPAIPLDTGVHTLYVQERDSIGNWSAAAWFDITIDITPPSAPIVSGPAATADPTPTWTWISGANPGAGVFRCKLNDPNLAEGAFLTLAGSYTCSTALGSGSHRLYVQERDDAGNWSASGSFAITVDVTPPNAPIVAAPRATSRLRPTWNWRSGGNGGAGKYRWRLDTPVFLPGDSGSAVLTFIPSSDLAQGNRVLYVQERDSLGNWSVAAACTVAVLPHVTFVDSAASGTPADGSSWENALRTILDARTQVGTVGKEVWVARGTYVVSSLLTVAGKLRGGFTGVERDTVRDWQHNLSVMRGNQAQRMLSIGNGALVEAFVIRDGAWDTREENYGLVQVGGGILKHCVVRDCGQGDAPAIILSSGGRSVLDGCVVLGELVWFNSQDTALALNSVLYAYKWFSVGRCCQVRSCVCLGGGVSVRIGSPRVVNSVVAAVSNLAHTEYDRVSYDYSCLPDSTLARLGSHNIVGDPCFVGPLPANPLTLPDSIWFTRSSPLLLDTARSPCWNKGLYSADGPATDIRGMPRPTTPAEQAANPIDIGAYEQ